jgi:hypothetical protein
MGIPDGFEACTCEDFAQRLAACKHIFLVRFWLAAPIVDGKPQFPPVPPRKAPIDWSTYHQAQCEEYRLFHVLLRDLCKGIPEPARDPHRAGRPPVLLRNQAFCAVQKSYVGFPLRSSKEFRIQAAANGQLDDPAYWSVASRFLCRTDVTEALHNMLARSAIPLIGLEDQCAIDSTGLRTSRFNYYRHERYEPERQNVWLKFHALVGVNTHVIPVLEVSAGSASDSPFFPELLKRATDNGFRFKEVLADKGYQSRENFNAASKLGIEPYIPFKRNQTGQSKGSPMYHKMFLFFQYHRERFDAHYGQRAQVESAFAGFKQRFGETLVSKTFTSQLNEVLCKAIGFNITILIRQMFEAGILPEFLEPQARLPSAAVEATPVPNSNLLSLIPTAVSD